MEKKIQLTRGGVSDWSIVVDRDAVEVDRNSPEQILK